MEWNEETYMANTLDKLDEQESIVDALAKAGYDCDKCHYGWDALRQIGQEFGDNFRLYTFGNF